jgi:hypothetical protein
VSHQPTPMPGRPICERWYVVDRTGAAVSVGYRHRCQAQAELEAITTVLRRELQRLGRSPQRIGARLAGFSVGATHRPTRPNTLTHATDRSAPLDGAVEWWSRPTPRTAGPSRLSDQTDSGGFRRPDGSQSLDRTGLR